MSKKTKANAVGGKLRMEDLTPQVQSLELTEAEKITFGLLLERAQQLQAQSQQVNIAISGQVTQIVRSRGLDPAKFGVNLAAGKILPLEVPPVKAPNGDGKEEKIA